MPKFNIVLRQAAAIFLLLGLLTACGLKGDLFLPSNAPANSGSTASGSTSRTTTEAADTEAASSEDDEGGEQDG